MMNFEPIKVITFDCYGTLVDWESGILDAIRPVLDRHLIDTRDDKILETFARVEAAQEQQRYVRYEVLLRLVMAQMSFQLGFDASVRELDCLSKSIRKWKPFPGTVSALRKLKKKYKLGIISNIDDKLFEATARYLKVPFDWIVTSEQVEAYKPSPKNFETALARIGLPREQILHVAQSRYHDIVPARAMGLSTVWVNRRKDREGTGATLPAAAEPDVEVPDLKTLTKLMGL